MMISVFTPTYNRGKTLPQLYESLKNQSYKNFEWIVVNDGSTDNTEELVENWIHEGVINIQYITQSNNGKHIAMNRAVAIAKGDFFTTVDSDDMLLDDGLEILINAWHSVPDEEFEEIASIKTECIDLSTGKKLGPSFKNGMIICNYLDARYKKKINYEMQSLTRVEVLKEFPNPEILGGPSGGGLRFYPETIWQDRAARKYLTIFLDKPTFKYRTDSSESLLGRGKKYNRYRENIYLWAHIINDNFDYFIYEPKEFLKALVGISMDGRFNKLGFRGTISIVNGILKKILVSMFYPVGVVFYYIKR